MSHDTGTQRVIRPLSSPPSAFTEDAVFTAPGGEAELRYVYEHNGSMFSGGLRFHRVRAYRFRTEGHCTLWHIKNAYDTLVEVEHSGWVSELLAAERDGARWPWPIRHFLIYVDGAGAYEVASAEYDWLPEVEVE